MQFQCTKREEQCPDQVAFDKSLSQTLFSLFPHLLGKLEPRVSAPPADVEFWYHKIDAVGEFLQPIEEFLRNLSSSSTTGLSCLVAALRRLPKALSALAPYHFFVSRPYATVPIYQFGYIGTREQVVSLDHVSSDEGLGLASLAHVPLRKDMRVPKESLVLELCYTSTPLPPTAQLVYIYDAKKKGTSGWAAPAVRAKPVLPAMLGLRNLALVLELTKTSLYQEFQDSCSVCCALDTRVTKEGRDAAAKGCVLEEHDKSCHSPVLLSIEKKRELHDRCKTLSGLIRSKLQNDTTSESIPGLTMLTMLVSDYEYQPPSPPVAEALPPPAKVIDNNYFDFGSDFESNVLKACTPSDLPYTPVQVASKEAQLGVPTKPLATDGTPSGVEVKSTVPREEVDLTTSTPETPKSSNDSDSTTASDELDPDTASDESERLSDIRALALKAHEASASTAKLQSAAKARLAKQALAGLTGALAKGASKGTA